MNIPGRALPGGTNGDGPGQPHQPVSGAMPQPAGVAPGLVPTQWNVGQAQLSNGKVYVFLVDATPTGTHQTFLTPEQARAVGTELLRLAAAGQLLVGPPSPLLGG